MPTDLAVIGAGPAGLAASIAAAARGVHVTLVDAAPSAGGQFYGSPRPDSAPGAHSPAPSVAHLDQAA